MTAAAAPHKLQLIVVSGLSGSGKSTAVRALEDIGFFCIDNLPVPLIEPMLELAERAAMDKVAVVVDVRERHFLPDYERVVGRVKDDGLEFATLYLTSSDESLIRRFKETRRHHPLQGDGSVEDGVLAERELLEPIHRNATHVFDTSEYTVHALRRRVQDTFRLAPSQGVHLRLESFGFKHGAPREADYLFDVRFLSNPFFIPHLKSKRGTDASVAEFVHGQTDTAELIDHIVSLARFVMPRFERDGRGQVTFAVGCTGGHHRSVAIVEKLAQLLREPEDGAPPPYRVTAEHRDLERE